MSDSASDAATDQRLLDDLESGDEQVRAAAAAELGRRGHPRALEASLHTLDDAAGPAHADITPAVWQLASFGLAALDGVLDRMADAPPMTRLHAARAAEQITKRQYGWDGREWPGDAYERWATWWQHEIGYAYDAPAAERTAAVGRLRATARAWAQEQQPPAARP